MNLPPYDRDAAQALLKEKPGAPFSAYDTATRAHRRSDLKREDEAALLFCLAAERADAEHAADGSTPNQAMNYIVRAGIAFNRAGKIATAEPLLRQAIAFDWAEQGLPHDSHMVEWAFYQLLLNAKDEPARFASLFAEAVSRSSEIGRDFTAIHPHQEHLLDIAIEIGQRSTIERLAGKITDRHPAKKATKDLLKRSAAFLAKQT